MKTVRFLFSALFFAGSLLGIGLGYSFAQVTRQASSQDGEKAISSAVADGQKDTQSADGKNTNSENPDGKPTHSEGASKITIKGSAKSNPVKPVQNHPRVRSANSQATDTARPEVPENAPHFFQAAISTAASGTSTAAPSKPRSYRSSSAPVSSFAVNGQQFRNSRDPGAHLAVSGGPANSTRGTAAINGSDFKRRP
jgi:hypothetical protein